MDSESEAQIAGLVLAAGYGRRLGAAKGLLIDSDGTPRVRRVCDQLIAAECRPLVVLGPEASYIRSHLPPEASSVDVSETCEGGAHKPGLGLSLRTGLQVLTQTTAQACAIMLIDLPGVTAAAVLRVVGRAHTARARELASVRARGTWGGRPGHPVVLGRSHWPEALDSARGDQGARMVLSRPGTVVVECGDLGHGNDIDQVSDLERYGMTIGTTPRQKPTPDSRPRPKP
ncbi:nucleotidyltransferase family protein [Brevibacterium sp. BDJS002]|uniref:nucleotidyltransferase family protein n=1 Tax=Brevibacterium sp. BDJS002 TaxID=3020906 RepID=UPI003FA43565